MTDTSPRKSHKVLVAGVPFGRDNVGDEAILECIVSIVAKGCPAAEIWVSTDDRHATEKKLDVNTYPLFGFDPPGYRQEELIAAIDTVDTFIWAGATGLSDYPDVPLGMLKLANERGKKTAIFCTGMNTELNPSLYKLLPGRRFKLFSLVNTLSFGLVDLIAGYETRKRKRTAVGMKEGVENTGLVIVRDMQSLDVLRHFTGSTGSNVTVGADPAIEITPKPIEFSGVSGKVKEYCRQPGRKIGLCLSAQSPVQQLNEVGLMFDRLVQNSDINIIGIPMNPITDTELMESFSRKLKNPDSMCIAKGRLEPDEITGLASEMDVVISSRLHLLILASITLTPFIGISRGSKITNFTDQFGLPEIGSVDSMDVDALEKEILRLLENRADFERVARETRAILLERLNYAKHSLCEFVNA